jgi:hypothetical protein
MGTGEVLTILWMLTMDVDWICAYYMGLAARMQVGVVDKMGAAWISA